MKFWVLGAERTTHPDGVEEVKEEEGQGTCEERPLAPSPERQTKLKLLAHTCKNTSPLQEKERN